jgi:hypothetical protein
VLQVIPFEEEYEIGAELGSGAFATVKLCTQRKSGTLFVVRRAVMVVEEYISYRPMQQEGSLLLK